MSLIKTEREIRTDYGRIKVTAARQRLSSLSGATATATAIIPDGALVLGVVVRVSTAITGATSFQVGDGSDADRWGAAIAIDVDTTSTPADFTSGTVAIATSATNVVLTANGSNFTAGTVDIVVWYIWLTAPES